MSTYALRLIQSQTEQWHTVSGLGQMTLWSSDHNQVPGTLPHLPTHLQCGTIRSNDLTGR